VSLNFFDFNTAKTLTPEERAAMEAGTALPGLEAANWNRAFVAPVLADRPAFEPRKSRFVPEAFDDIEPLSEPAVVKGLWPSTGVCFVYGPSMSGKSFWILDAVARVCRGLPVLGLKSIACGALYIASEDAGGIRIRIAGLRQEIGPLGPRFVFIGQAPDLTESDGDVADLRATIEEVQLSMQAKDVRLGVVVIDTFSASAPGADENSAKDMSPVLSTLQAMARELELLVVVVHHTGKNVDLGMRGWSGLFANADGVIGLDEAKADGVRCGTAEKVKNGVSGRRFAFTLETVTVGYDSDGDAITTCVVVEADLPEGASGKRSRMPPRQEIMLRAINICIDNGRVAAMPLGPGIPPGSMGVSRQEAKACAAREGLVDESMTQDAQRKAFNDAISGLIARGRVREQGGILMLI
jgi:hypothetical protein